MKKKKNKSIETRRLKRINKLKHFYDKKRDDGVITGIISINVFYI